MEIEKQKNIKGFTLIEMLVVVLIIGILAAIALPQYQMAVTKAKIAAILPIMKRWSDAYQEYYLQHNSYLTEEGDVPDTDTLGVSWPSDWTCNDSYLNGGNCWNDYWDCYSNENGCGDIYCFHFFSNDDSFDIELFPPHSGCDGGFGLRQCSADGTISSKVCLAIGGVHKKWGHYAF